MPRRRNLLPLVALLAIVQASAARANTIAHFKVFEVTDVCNVNDSEPITAGPPDLRFRMIIADFECLNVCAAGCGADDDPNTLDATSADHCGYYSTCGTWDFEDFELTKVIKDHKKAYYNFVLTDDDTDADDLMGQSFIGPGPILPITTGWNNNLNTGVFAQATQVCGDPVEGDGWAHNYQLVFGVWYSDSDGPFPIAAPVAWDNGSPASVDDDQRLDFEWDAPQDPNTGISAVAASLYDVGLPDPVWSQNVATTATSLSVCPSGCDGTFTPLAGHQYKFQVSAINGAFPSIVDPETTTSAPALIAVSALVGVGGAPAVVEPSLFAPVPNPTRAGAQLAYSLPEAGEARLELVDLQGRVVSTLADDVEGAGLHQVAWNGRDAAGSQLMPGVYWVRLVYGDLRRLQRLVVVR